MCSTLPSGHSTLLITIHINSKRAHTLMSFSMLERFPKWASCSSSLLRNPRHSSLCSGFVHTAYTPGAVCPRSLRTECPSSSPSVTGWHPSLCLPQPASGITGVTVYYTSNLTSRGKLLQSGLHPHFFPDGVLSEEQLKALHPACFFQQSSASECHTPHGPQQVPPLFQLSSLPKLAFFKTRQTKAAVSGKTI